MEIILHCGFPKTATTFLQFFFFYNKLQLEKNGIFYPTISGPVHDDCAPGTGYVRCADNMLFYIEQAKAKGFRRILFSNEYFSYTDFSDYGFLKEHQVTCVSFVRYFTSGNESLLHQFTRIPFAPDNAEDLRVTPVVVLNSLLREKKFFNNVEVYSYEDAKNTNIAKFFLRILKIDDISCFNFNIDHFFAKNRSLYTAEALFMNDIQVLPLSRQDRYSIYNYLLKNCVTSLKKNYLFIPAQIYRALAKEQADSIKELALLMGCDHYGEGSLQWLEGMEACPWKRLPQSLWEEIFYNLPQATQNAIREALPPRHSLFQSAGLLQSPDFFPGYIMKNYRDSFDYPQTYEAAIAVARQLPFDPSYRDGQYTMGVFWGRFKNLWRLSYNEIASTIYTQWFNKRYRNILLVELSNKIDQETFNIIESDDHIYDERFLEQLLFKISWHAHRKYIYDQAERLAGREVYFGGCGEIYSTLHVFFNKSIVKRIIVDKGPHAENVNGIPVGHPDDILPYTDAIPIVIFSNQASNICKKIQGKYLQYTDIVTCTMV